MNGASDPCPCESCAEWEMQARRRLVYEAGRKAAEKYPAEPSGKKTRASSEDRPERRDVEGAVMLRWLFRKLFSTPEPSPVDRLCESLVSRPWEWTSEADDPAGGDEEGDEEDDEEEDPGDHEEGTGISWSVIRHRPTGVSVWWRKVYPTWSSDYAKHEVHLSPFPGTFVALDRWDGERLLLAAVANAGRRVACPVPTAEELPEAGR